MSLHRIEVGITGITAILIWDTSGVVAAAVVPHAVSAPGRCCRGRSRMTCWRPVCGAVLHVLGKAGDAAHPLRGAGLSGPMSWLVVLVGGLGRFALARLRFSGADALSFFLLVGTSVPALLYMVPLYFMWARLGW